MIIADLLNEVTGEKRRDSETVLQANIKEQKQIAEPVTKFSGFRRGGNRELPLSSAKISVSGQEAGILTTKVLYAIRFTWGSTDQQIVRRFSHFRALRLALSKQLLYSPLHPTHRKRLVKLLEK